MILEKLLNEAPVDMALPAYDASPPEEPKLKSPAIGTATCEVWSGEDEKLAGFLVAALNENGIPARVEGHGLGSTVFAPPEDKSRAREIIREITEASPPE